jgi:hypothetical protein
MSKSYTGGLNFSWPTKGDTNWDTTADSALTTVSAHGHTGSGDGSQISTAGIAANSVTGAKILLANDEALRARQASSTIVDILKLNASNLLEFVQRVLISAGSAIYTAITTPSTPASGQATTYVDSVTKRLSVKDDAGFVRSLGTSNFSTAAQVVPATTRTYITGSAVAVPTNKMQVGTCFRWVFDMTKTAAGIAASTIDIAVGTAGTTADTARVSFTKPSGTAAIDTARCTVEAIVRGPLTGSGVMAGVFTMTHNLASTGHATIPCVNVTTVSAGFDVTVSNLIVGLCITTGAADAITIQCVTAEAWNL